MSTGNPRLDRLVELRDDNRNTFGGMIRRVKRVADDNFVNVTDDQVRRVAHRLWSEWYVVINQEIIKELCNIPRKEGGKNV
jgi:hypothetical protein